MDDERVLTVPEVAAKLRVREDAVRRWLREGRLKGFRPGGTKTGWRIRASEVERMMEPEDVKTAV
jgi:excisionase family DNA binding protein